MPKTEVSQSMETEHAGAFVKSEILTSSLHCTITQVKVSFRFVILTIRPQ